MAAFGGPEKDKSYYGEVNGQCFDTRLYWKLKEEHDQLEADLRKIVERMRNVAGCTESVVDAGDAVDYWADEIEQLLKRGEGD
jgi:hypothetical protein